VRSATPAPTLQLTITEVRCSTGLTGSGVAGAGSSSASGSPAVVVVATVTTRGAAAYVTRAGVTAWRLGAAAAPSSACRPRVDCAARTKPSSVPMPAPATYPTSISNQATARRRKVAAVKRKLWSAAAPPWAVLRACVRTFMRL
jgi:hypothetical protein